MLKAPDKPPSWRFLIKHPAYLIACGFGSGLLPFASGTVATLFAWGVFLILSDMINREVLLVLFVILFIIGIWAAHKTGLDLGRADHGSIVWDEIVPFWIVLWYCPRNIAWQLIAFFLFRLFDILKPEPARYIDRKIKNGLGVMCDDLVAAVYTILSLVGLQAIWTKLVL